MKTLQETMMSRCLGLAYDTVSSGNYPLGSLVAIDNTIIAEASSKLIAGRDPTAHPEMVAIRQAAEAQQSRFMEDATLYTTLEPCPMCAGAAVWAKMGGIVFGASQEDAIDWGGKQPRPCVFLAPDRNQITANC